MYGSRELLKFLAVVDVAGALAALTLSYVAYAATLDGDLLYTPFSGGHGLVAGLLVALKQATPGQDVRLLGRVALQTRYLPLLYVLAASATAALVRGAWTLLPFVLAGSYCAWLYLRFFQPCGGPGDAATRYGDASDDFRYDSGSSACVQ